MAGCVLGDGGDVGYRCLRIYIYGIIVSSISLQYILTSTSTGLLLTFYFIFIFIFFFTTHSIFVHGHGPTYLVVTLVT